MAAHWSRFACAALLALSFVACGDDDGGDGVTIDAPNGTIDAPGGNPDAPAAPACSDYCTTIATNCTAANQMYGTPAQCTATCGKFTPGTVGMMSTNTLGCRLYHAGAASGNPGLHCRHAGPGGDGACGSNCEGFCTIVQASCSTQASPPYASMQACMTACAGFATTPDYSSATQSGNTLACRLYHATAAANDPAGHCAHTGATSTPCQ